MIKGKALNLFKINQHPLLFSQLGVCVCVLESTRVHYFAATVTHSETRKEKVSPPQRKCIYHFSNPHLAAFVLLALSRSSKQMHPLGAANEAFSVSSRRVAEHCLFAPLFIHLSAPLLFPLVTCRHVQKYNNFSRESRPNRPPLINSRKQTRAPARAAHNATLAKSCKRLFLRAK